MTLSLVLQLVSTTIMIIGVAFGILSIRQYQASRRRESAILVLNSFQTAEFIKGLMTILRLPDDIDPEAIERLPADEYLALYLVIGTWERLGVLVFRREIDIQMVEDAYSGPVIQSWMKLGRYIQTLRDHWQRQSAMEWFQWLAERMIERERGVEPAPAYLSQRNWQASG
jgi:hypothetical protein